MESVTLLLLYLAIPSLVYSIVQHVLSWSKARESGRSAASGAGPVAPPRFPGPKLFPIIGRVHDLPRFSMWLKLKEWADIYGPIYYTRMLNQEFLIVSDEKIADELLVQRGNIYSGRPQIRSLFGHKAGPVYSALMDRHDIWSRQRKWVHAAMAESHRHHFYGHIEEETRRYLVALLIDPERFYDHSREFCGRIMSRLAWDDATQGRRNGDSADNTLHCMSVSGPITNTMTPLWHIPERINPWKKYERKREARLRSWWLNNYGLAKQRFLDGTLPDDTWAWRYFDQVKREGNPTLVQTLGQEEFASCMIGFFNLVGVVTISGPLKFFLMAMALHPEWVKRCQDEIDRVCGDRMPKTSDFPDLPTVRACLKETLRWRSGVPLGVPHQAERDDVYRGVHVRKGTIVLACEWNINRIAEKYPDPENYHPERYLEPGWPTYQEPLTRYPNFREGVGRHTFGWGRRTCLGQNIVDDELMVGGAGVLWAFDLAQKTCPRTGEKVPIDSKATNSHVILEPDPWQMEFKPRSAKRSAQVLDGYKDMAGFLRV